MRRLARRLAMFAALAAAAWPAAAQPPIWTVHAPHATLTLFGSVHILPPDLDWRPPALDQALARADELWFELPIDESTDAAAAYLVRSRGMLPAGSSLYDRLSPAEAQNLRALCDALGLPQDLIGAMQPWMAEMTLTLAQDGRLGGAARQGVEWRIAEAAPASARRRAFESAAQQIAFLSGAPAEDQLASLEQTVRELREKPRLYDEVVRAWMAGDLATIEEDALAPTAKASPTLYRRVISQRNARWADILARRLEGRGNLVVVVGVGHLIGPGGVPALLRRRGFDVEGP